MLAVLKIRMKWNKENRTPKGAVQREQYYKPVQIEEDVSLAGKGIFLKESDYEQMGSQIYSDQEYAAQRKQAVLKKKNKPFAGLDRYEEQSAYRAEQARQKRKGTFYADILALEKRDLLRCISIIEEGNDCYRIKWFDQGIGMPRRRGGNEDFMKRGAKLAGQPNVLNETAFILKKGESGLLKYNFRMQYFDGEQYYLCFYVYMVNTDVLTRDAFLRKYDYEYEQMADLF